jgi:hypothetical protein
VKVGVLFPRLAIRGPGKGSVSDRAEIVNNAHLTHIPVAKDAGLPPAARLGPSSTIRAIRSPSSRRTLVT